MFEIVLASRNKAKKRELKALLQDFKINPVPARRYGVKVSDLDDYPSAPEVEERGRTFDENAKSKALAIANFTKKLTLADDSGLEVKALGGKPGVRSARFAGEGATYAEINKKLLKLLLGIPKSRRKAKFVCVIAIADRDGLIGIARGECSGRISFTPRGNYGFGYDPIFVYPKYNKTFAELGPKIKNKISHRAKALKKARAIIQTYLRKAL